MVFAAGSRRPGDVAVGEYQRLPGQPFARIAEQAVLAGARRPHHVNQLPRFSLH